MNKEAATGVGAGTAKSSPLERLGRQGGRFKCWRPLQAAAPSTDACAKKAGTASKGLIRMRSVPEVTGLQEWRRPGLQPVVAIGSLLWLLG